MSVAMGRALGVLLVVAACGGQIETGDGGTPESSSSSGGSGSGGGSGGTSFPLCPPDAPAVGMACAPADSSQGCAYIGAGGSCQAFVCDGSGTWQPSKQGC